MGAKTNQVIQPSAATKIERGRRERDRDRGRETDTEGREAEGERERVRQRTVCSKSRRKGFDVD